MTYTRRWAVGSFDDVQTGADWYDECQSGLGAQFAAEVLATTERAVRRPFLFKVYKHDLPRRVDRLQVVKPPDPAKTGAFRGSTT